MYNTANFAKYYGQRHVYGLSHPWPSLLLMKEYESAKLQLYRSESFNKQQREIRHLFDRSVCKSLKVLLGKHWPDILATTIDSIYYFENYLSENSQHWTGDARGQDASSCFCK
jgi:hypothetical protein